MENQSRQVKLNNNLFFYDLEPPANNALDEVISGLIQNQKQIDPKFFYDELGSQLFEKITLLPEYYPTRTEIEIMQNHRQEICEYLDNSSSLIEFGSGSSHKVKLLLDELKPDHYVSIEISKDFLVQSATQLAQEFPWLQVHAICADYNLPVPLPMHVADSDKCGFFPGSTIGNFEPTLATEFLRNMATVLGSDSKLLIGVDLKKEQHLLNNAYNDAQGITADFNKNALNNINQITDANFNTDAFDHRAFYNPQEGRIEMHLISQKQQTISIGDLHIKFAEGESIHTENSYKYTIEEFHTLADKAGFSPIKVWTDEQSLFSIHLMEAA